jgi:hypothetical protein
MSSPGHSLVNSDKAPEGVREEVEVPEMAFSAPRGHGRPKGSCNKSTLEALAARAAAASSSSVVPQATGTPGDVVILEKQKPGRPKGSGKRKAPMADAAPSSSRRRGRPPGSKNKKAPAIFRVDATPTGPRATVSPPLGPSRPWLEKPMFQPPEYISAQGWSTCIIPVLAGARDRLRLPTLFTSSMEDQGLAYAKLRECSGGQPTYRVEVYYDGQGVCYFRDGWSKFFINYDMHKGWFILLTRQDEKDDFTLCLFDGTLSARAFAAQP